MLVDGTAECHWSELKTKNSGAGTTGGHQTVSYRGEDVFLNQRVYMFGQKGAEAVEVQSGVYRYNFEFPLPPHLPGSLEASRGHIRYKVKAVLDIPWAFDKEFSLQFTLVRRYDLNVEPALRIPSKVEELKRFCCLFCESEPFLVTVTIPYSGFIPGQVIPIEISYNNKSQIDIDTTKIAIVRNIRYTSDRPYKIKVEPEEVIKTQYGGVGRGDEKTYNTEITLPLALLSSSAKICRVIQVSYELKVEAVAKGFHHRNVNIVLPIEIGSIPINFNDSLTQMNLPQSYATQNAYSDQHVAHSSSLRQFGSNKFIISRKF